DGGWNGGLPRHGPEGFAAGGVAVSTQNRLDFTKELVVAKPVYYPEAGTDLEQVAMAFHAERCHDSFLPDGSAADCDPYDLNDSGKSNSGGFITNGAPAVRGAPFNEPCVDDQGDLLLSSTASGGQFFNDQPGGFFDAPAIEFGAENPRLYKASVIQLDAVFNKVGYHYPQQRIITLWEDALPTINKQKPPEPFVIRMNTFDCTMFLHTNLVPKYYELDDYQVRTPTDIIGQHIHLPKWDLTTADGSANGWNYEDGTLSPGMVRERIEAINAFNDSQPEGAKVLSGQENEAGHLEPLPHPFFGTGPNSAWLGARTTTQRWFADPVVNVQGEDRGLGIIFTHDHFGPSTHQQIGLYATVLTEPAGSAWVHNETGEPLYTRPDGGPTSWQVAILDGDYNLDGIVDQTEADRNFREFYLEFSDMQHAYQPGVYIGAGPDGQPMNTETALGFVPDPDSFRDAINPSYRQATSEMYPDLFLYPPICPGGVPRPCPEAVDADDPGMLVVNYRNESIGLRIYDPNATGPDGKPGSQAEALDRNADGIVDGGEAVAGDLAFALATNFQPKGELPVPITRAIPELNVQPDGSTIIDGTAFPPPLNAGLLPTDPFTPMLRAHPGDLVRLKVQTGAHEEEHNVNVHGVKWLQGGSGHGLALNSGWRNSQAAGISEQFTFA
ncbi:MAG: hypothetical protein V3R71_08900, partial [Gemmatimonadales bacterium]